MTRSYARSAKGSRAYGLSPYPSRGNLSLLGAISLRGVLGAMTVNGGTTKAVFLTYLEKILIPQLWSDAVVVMDNLSAHKAKVVQSALRQAGIGYVYLSPYSPDFNPIENCWSKVKEELRSVEARTRETLEEAINQALERITPEHIRNWFTHCCYCTS